MSLATLYLRLQADSSRLIPQVEGASAEAGEKGAAAYQKSFKARMEGKQIYGSVKQAEAAGLRDGSAYAKKVKEGFNKAGKISFVALVAGAVVATKLAADLQTQITKLYTSAGESQKNLAKDMKGVLDISVLTATSTTQLSASLYTINSAGYHGADGLNILRVAAQGARAEQANLADVADAVTTALKDYNLSSKDATRVTNTYTAAVSEGKTTYEEFVKSLSTVQALAAANGISLGDLTGVLATLTDHGVSAQEATQQLAFTIRNLAAPNAVATKAMAQLGISSVEVAKGLGKAGGLSATILTLSNTIIKHMGPDGLVLLKSLNQSATAAQDARLAMDKLPPAARNVAQAYANGKISLGDYRQELKGLPADQASLVQQWKNMQDRSKGFSDELKAGTPAAKTYTQELSKMLGGANGLQVALQLGSDGFVGMEHNVNGTINAYNRGNKSVDGFAAVQKTFNFQLGAAKESLNKIAVTVGTKLLPPATSFFKLLAAHQTTLKGLLITTTALAAVMALSFASTKIAAGIKAVVIGVKAIKAATEADTVAQWALNVAEYANPIGLVVAAIIVALALIAVAAYEIYKHWSGFSGFFIGIWKAVWGFLKGVGAWFAGPFVNFFVQAGKDIAAPFLWFWHTVIYPAWQGVVAIIRTGSNIIAGIIRGVGAVFTWLNTNIVRPVFAALSIPIGIFAKITEIAFKVVELAVILLGRGFMNLWKFAILPAINGIVALAKWLWQQVWVGGIAPFIAGISWLGREISSLWTGKVLPFFQLIVSLARWLWQQVWNGGIAPFIAGLNWLGGVFVSLWKNYIEPAWNKVRDILVGGWNWIVSNVWDPMKDLITKKIPGWWDTGVKGIGKIWDGLKSIAKEPIKFFVNTVLDDGLIAGFNWVDKALGNPVKQIAPYKLPNGFAAGGYTGNGAKHEPMGVVHGGEYVLTKEQTADIGVGNLNRAFGKGKRPRQPGDTSHGVAIRGYADGGFVGWLKGAFNALTDPVGSIKKKANDLLGKIPGAGSITSLVKGAAGQIIGGLGTALSKFVSASDGSYSGPITPNIKAAQEFVMSQNHKPYVWAGAGPGGADCSGFVSEVYNILSGKKSPWGHTFSTSNEAGFFPLKGHGAFTAGWSGPGERGGGDVGHTAGNLAGLAFESGGAGGDMHFGKGSTSVDSFAHVGHMRGYAQGGAVTNDHGVVVNLDGSKLGAQEQWAMLNAAVGRHLRMN